MTLGGMALAVGILVMTRPWLSRHVSQHAMRKTLIQACSTPRSKSPFQHLSPRSRFALCSSRCAADRRPSSCSRRWPWQWYSHVGVVLSLPDLIPAMSHYMLGPEVRCLRTGAAMPAAARGRSGSFITSSTAVLSGCGNPTLVVALVSGSSRAGAWWGSGCSWWRLWDCPFCREDFFPTVDSGQLAVACQDALRHAHRKTETILADIENEIRQVIPRARSTHHR